MPCHVSASKYRTHLKGPAARLGKIDDTPVLYACGAEDESDLCKEEFGVQSGELISHYTYLRVDDCGHNVLRCDGQQTIIDAIIAHVSSEQEHEQQRIDSASRVGISRQ